MKNINSSENKSKFECENPRIVIKFRDDLLINNNFPFFQSLDIPVGYQSEVRKFMQKTGKKINTFDRKKNFYGINAKALGNQLNIFTQIIKTIKLEYLFSDVDIQVFNIFVDRSIKRQRNFIKYPYFTNFYNYFTFDCSCAENADTFLKSLKENLFNKECLNTPLLEFAYIRYDPIPASFDIANIPNNENQDYLTDMGFGSDWNNGMGITVIDVEEYWDTSHSQFDWGSGTDVRVPNLLYPTTLNGINFVTNDSTGHGTKVLGVLKSKHSDNDSNSVDKCKGIVPNALFNLSSVISTSKRNNVVSFKKKEECALLKAIFGSSNSETPEGSVVLLPIQVPIDPSPYPIEILPAMFQLIQLATYQLNIIVIEAAGDGGIDLDSITSNDITTVLSNAVSSGDDTSYWKRYRKKGNTNMLSEAGVETIYSTKAEFATDYLNLMSGAIIVGAGQKNDDLFQKFDRTNIGIVRVPIYAQGDKILTTIIDHGSKFDSFSATSGATAIIAGLVVSLQGYARANGRLILPQEMMELLLIGGRDVINGTAIIGKIPNYSDITSFFIDDENISNYISI